MGWLNDNSLGISRKVESIDRLIGVVKQVRLAAAIRARPPNGAVVLFVGYESDMPAIGRPNRIADACLLQEGKPREDSALNIKRVDHDAVARAADREQQPFAVRR